jgi:dethiobiotin synthetase
LLHALTGAGLGAVGLKPVESGIGEGVSDTERLAGASTFHVKPPPPYALAAPISPHLAAAREGVTIALTPIVRWVSSFDATWVVVESAGALLSPLNLNLTNLDLTVALDPSIVIMVAPDRLGVLHDVTAAMFALRTLVPRLPEPAVALLAPAEPDASTGTNAAELLTLGIASIVTTFPRAAADAETFQVAARGLLGSLGVEGFT